MVSISLNTYILKISLSNNNTVYDLPADILSTLTPKEDAEPEQENIDTPSTTKEPSTEEKAESVAGSNACSLCGMKFHTVEDQRSHVRSDLHGYNLKQRIRGAKPVSENDFEKLVGGRYSAHVYIEAELMSKRSQRKSIRFRFRRFRR